MVEIERKFLVDLDRVTLGDISNKTYKIKQGYLMESERDHKILRIRISGNEAFLTYKSGHSAMKRLEFEQSIQLEDALELLSTCSHVIEKTRIEYMHRSMLWEIDIFHGDNEGLIVAEIELEHEGQKFFEPYWVGKEVTDDTRYINSNLLKHPYKEWGKP